MCPQTSRANARKQVVILAKRAQTTSTHPSVPLGFFVPMVSENTISAHSDLVTDGTRAESCRYSGGCRSRDHTAYDTRAASAIDTTLKKSNSNMVSVVVVVVSLWRVTDRYDVDRSRQPVRIRLVDKPNRRTGQSVCGAEKRKTKNEKNKEKNKNSKTVCRARGGVFSTGSEDRLKTAGAPGARAVGGRTENKAKTCF